MTTTTVEPCEIEKASAEFEAADRRRALAVIRADATDEREAIREMNQIAARREAHQIKATDLRRRIREQRQRIALAERRLTEATRQVESASNNVQRERGILQGQADMLHGIAGERE